MACAEEVDGGRRGEAAFCRENDLHEILVAVTLHQRHHGADGSKGKTEVLDGLSRLLPEIGEDAALHRSCEVCVGEELACLADTLHRCRKLPCRPLPAGIRRGGDIQGNDDIASYRLLELERLLVADFDLAVDRELERSRVGHDDAVEVENAVKPICDRLIAELLAPPEYVGVRDQGFDAHLLHLAGGNQGEVGVDDGEECGRPDHFVVHPELADPSCDIFVYDLKRNCHWG